MFKSCTLAGRLHPHELIVATIGLLALAYADVAVSGVLVENTTVDFGSYRGVSYVRHSGRFVGVTPQGEFRVPYEIVAPAEPHRSNRIVVFEPPHFLFGANGRDSVLGPALLFNRRFSHATVGFSNNGYNLLDPFVVDAVIAGQSVTANMAPILRDVDILKQFVVALSTDAYAIEALGPLRLRYAYGVSQSAEALYELQFTTGAAGLFDLTVLHVPLWRPPFADPGVLERLPETFHALPDVGKVMLVSSEGDLLISESEELRSAVTGSYANANYRLYEVAGAPHFPLDMEIEGVRLNPLDVAPVVRAVFVSGHRWARYGRRPPASLLLDSAPDGEIDPVYGIDTGIARDADGNALGGVRFPDVQNGRARHVASAPEIEIVPGLAGLVGFWFDLACEPAAGSGTEPRFSSRGRYLRSVIRQSLRLLVEGYLLPSDTAALIRAALESGVGSRDYCAGGG